MHSHLSSDFFLYIHVYSQWFCLFVHNPSLLESLKLLSLSYTINKVWDFLVMLFSFSIESYCSDINGNKVKHGDSFVPQGDDFCRHCKCLSGRAEQCFTTECAVPTCKGYKAVPGKCCAFTCPSG